MKSLPALLSASLALFMVSCTSPIVKRIERNPDIYNSLSGRHQQLVQQGRIEDGMTKKAVFLALGRPDRAAQGSKSGRFYEKWSYAGYQPVHTTGFGFTGGYWGGGYGCGYGHGLMYEPMTTYVPYEAARVEFLNGIVTAWERSR
jgi:hypothetical protein